MVLLLMEYYISLLLIGIMKGFLTHYLLELLRIIDRWSYQQVILRDKNVKHFFLPILFGIIFREHCHAWSTNLTP